MRLFYYLLLFIMVFMLASLPVLGGELDDWIYLSTKQDIQQADPLSTHISIRDLELKDYPLLDKFRKVREIDYYCPAGTCASTEKFKAIVALKFRKLDCVILTNDRLVTDEGIAELAKIPSLTQLGLEGTSITDAALETMVTMRLAGVNLANCKMVTLNGLKKLAASKDLTDIGFSADDLTQAEILDLFNTFRKVNSCQIVDPQKRLDEKVLQAEAGKKKINLSISTKGALQWMDIK